MGFCLRVVGLIIRLLLRLVGSAVVWLILTLRFLLPVLWRGVRLLTMLLVVSVVSFRMGLFTSTTRIARDWLGRAEHLGFPIQWEDALYKMLWASAFLTILTGWLLLSFTFWVVVNLSTDMLM